MNDAKEEKILLTTAEAARRLDCKVTTVRRLVRERKIPFYQIGGMIRIHPSDIERMRVASPPEVTGPRTQE